MSLFQQISQPVQWFEGMLLSPQHFQQNNSYFEQLMFHQLQRTTPFYFGAIELTFDQTAMADQKLLVEKVHAVMTDGTVINYGLDDNNLTPCANNDVCKLLEFDLTRLKNIKPQTPFFIYLAIAKQHTASSLDSPTELRRYDSINTGKVRDQYDAHNQVDLVRLQAKLQLLVASELSANYSYFPIAKIQQNHDGSFQSLNYTPPILAVHSLVSEAPARSTLGERIETLIATLRSKAVEQRNYFMDKQSSNSPFSHIQKQNLHILSQSLPGLEVMIKSKNCHPYDLYLAMVNLAAGLAIFQDDVLPPVYPAYNHQNLDNIFQPVLNNISHIINKLQLNFEIHALILNDDNEFCYQYTKPLDSDVLMLSFRLATGVSREQLISWISNAYFCTKDKKDYLLNERILGCNRKQTTAFIELNLQENDDEVFFNLSVNENFLTDGQPLSITGSDHQLDKFAPTAINWLVKSVKSNGSCKQKKEH